LRVRRQWAYGAALRRNFLREPTQPRREVEHNLAKVGVVGSNPIARSILPNIIRVLPEMWRLTPSIATHGEAGGKQTAGFWLAMSRFAGCSRPHRLQGEKPHHNRSPLRHPESSMARFEAGRLASRGRSRPLETHSDAIHRGNILIVPANGVGHHPLDYSHPRSLKAERSTPGGAYHPPEPYRAPSLIATSLLP
jgi:hypothetical protein